MNKETSNSNNKKNWEWTKRIKSSWLINKKHKRSKIWWPRGDFSIKYTYSFIPLNYEVLSDFFILSKCIETSTDIIYVVKIYNKDDNVWPTITLTNHSILSNWILWESSDRNSSPLSILKLKFLPQNKRHLCWRGKDLAGSTLLCSLLSWCSYVTNEKQWTNKILPRVYSEINEGTFLLS